MENKGVGVLVVNVNVSAQLAHIQCTSRLRTTPSRGTIGSIDSLLRIP